MKRKILMVLTVSVLISALAGCSFGKKEENASVGSSNVQTPAQSVVSEDEMTKITQSEISALGNNEFYVVNGTGSDITNIYAISKRDFDDTYRIIDEVNMKKAI